jgi:hypothetical protein
VTRQCSNGESASFPTLQRTVYTYSLETACEILRVLYDFSNFFYLDKVSSSTAVLRKEDNSGNTQWAMKLTGLATGEIAHDTTNNVIYVRFYHTGELIGYLVGFDYSTGSVTNAIKG